MDVRRITRRIHTARFWMREMCKTGQPVQMAKRFQNPVFLLHGAVQMRDSYDNFMNIYKTGGDCLQMIGEKSNGFYGGFAIYFLIRLPL
ncbi:hypothetical protein D5269_00465 [Anaerotruncus sp. 1XD42-93]|nr:hypothetical protein [Anaerotruncus sp. 1XD42-93]